MARCRAMQNGRRDEVPTDDDIDRLWVKVILTQGSVVPQRRRRVKQRFRYFTKTVCVWASLRSYVYDVDAQLLVQRGASRRRGVFQPLSSRINQIAERRRRKGRANDFGDHRYIKRVTTRDVLRKVGQQPREVARVEAGAVGARQEAREPGESFLVFAELTITEPAREWSLVVHQAEGQTVGNEEEKKEIHRVPLLFLCGGGRTATATRLFGSFVDRKDATAGGFRRRREDSYGIGYVVHIAVEAEIELVLLVQRLLDQLYFRRKGVVRINSHRNHVFYFDEARNRLTQADMYGLFNLFLCCAHRASERNVITCHSRATARGYFIAPQGGFMSLDKIKELKEQRAKIDPEWRAIQAEVDKQVQEKLEAAGLGTLIVEARQLIEQHRVRLQSQADNLAGQIAALESVFGVEESVEEVEVEE